MANQNRPDAFRLYGRKGGGVVDIAEAITENSRLELSVEGASTLTISVEDDGLKLLRSGIFERWAWGETGVRNEMAWVRKGRAVDCYLDDGDGGRVWFRLVKVSKVATTLTLTFEDRIVAYLRRHKGTRKLRRSKGTRAMFVQMLAREPKADGGVPTFVPELRIKQPIAKKDEATKAKDKKRDAEPGIASGTQLEIADASGNTRAATIEEIKNMERVLAVAYSLDASPKAVLALVEACMIESGFNNLAGGDADSRGILQIRDETAKGIRPPDLRGGARDTFTVSRDARGTMNNRDVEQSAFVFLTRGFWGRGGAIDIAKRSTSQTAGWVAQQTQGSAHPSRYDKVRPQAQAIVEAYHGGGGRDDGESRVYNKAYEFTRGKDEDSWTAMGRLAEEVAWRRFVRESRLWYVSEKYLFNQRAAMTISPDHEAVIAMDFDLDLEAARFPIAEVTIRAYVALWAALPGMVTVIEDSGPVNGRWLIATITYNPFSEDGESEVKLSKPVPAKPEPRPEEATTDGRVTSHGGVLDDGLGDADSKVARAYAAAEQVDSQNKAYDYGGGHGEPLSTIGPKDGLDCSSSCSLVLKRAGLFEGDVAQVSGWFAQEWGQPGKGKYLTVWANPDHVWIQFTIPGKRGWRFDTSPHGDGPHGPHLRTTARGTEGFTARHWPGT